MRRRLGARYYRSSAAALRRRRVPMAEALHASPSKMRGQGHRRGGPGCWASSPRLRVLPRMSPSDAAPRRRGDRRSPRSQAWRFAAKNRPPGGSSMAWPGSLALAISTPSRRPCQASARTAVRQRSMLRFFCRVSASRGASYPRVDGAVPGVERERAGDAAAQIVGLLRVVHPCRRWP